MAVIFEDDCQGVSGHPSPSNLWKHNPTYSGTDADLTWFGDNWGETIDGMESYGAFILDYDFYTATTGYTAVYAMMADTTNGIKFEFNHSGETVDTYQTSSAQQHDLQHSTGINLPENDWVHIKLQYTTTSATMSIKSLDGGTTYFSRTWTYSHAVSGGTLWMYTYSGGKLKNLVIDDGINPTEINFGKKITGVRIR